MTNDPAERADRHPAASGSVAPCAQRTPQHVGVWWQLLPALLIIGVGLYAYHNSLRVPFVFDDLRGIRDNPTIRTLWAAAHVAGRPVVNLSLAVNYALGGLNVWGYHIVNLAIHILGALVLYGVVRRTLLCSSLRQRYGDGARRLALAVALIWVAHPLQTESVTYLIQRSESLMGLFFLLTLYCVIRGATSSGQRGWYAGAVVCCALGMGSKEVMVVAPLVVLLYDRAFLSRSFREALRAHAGLYAGLFGFWLVLVGLFVSTPHLSVGFGLSVSPWEYARTQPGVLLHYLRLSFWPHPLVIDYDDWPIARTAAAVVPAGTLVVALAVATLWAARRWPHVGFLGGWFFLILAPTSSVVPLIGEIAAEHRMYLPLAAVIAFVVIGWHVVFTGICGRLGWGSGRRRIVEVVVLGAVVATLAQLTVRRNEAYQSDVALWTDVVANRPDSATGHNNLGSALAAQGKLDDAIGHYRAALRIDPTYVEAHNNLGSALAAQGKLDDAIGQYRKALRMRPYYPEAHNNLGTALAAQGKLDEAIGHYRAALFMRSNFSEAHYNLGNALVRQGKLDEAIAQYSEALRINPTYVEAHNNLGSVLVRQGKLDEAIAQYSEALRINPIYAQAHNNLGMALARQGKLDEAVAQYSEALRIAPSARGHYDLATALAREGRTQDAIGHLEAALQLDPGFQPARRALAQLTSSSAT
jgi:tetratricopeptide (TPR) repeat protein